jgi:hypothetical protein
MKNIDVDSEVAKILENGDYKDKFHKILELMGRIFDNRDSQYGDFKGNSEQIARLRSIIHNRRVRPEDVCIDHILDKLNRIVNGQNKADNYLDGANYFILMLLVSFDKKINIKKVFKTWAETGRYDYN